MSEQTTEAGLLPGRFWSKVEKTQTCWLWTAVLNSAGYGRFYLNGKMRLAHRLAFEADRGPVEPGLQLDHLCRNRACVNPQHLEPVTQRENILRGTSPAAVASRRSHCPQGHPYDEVNTLRSTSGSRRCRACSRDKHRRNAAKAAYLGRAS